MVENFIIVLGKDLFTLKTTEKKKKKQLKKYNPKSNRVDDMNLKF